MPTWMRAAAILLLCLGLLAPPALAQSLDEAKAQGLVGERIDGYVGVVPADPPEDIRQLVERINAERREKYAEVAAQRDIPVEAVAQIAGEKLIERTPPGQFVAGPDGTWRQK